MRIYHPEYRVTWVDRIWDLFDGHRPAPRRDGVDYSLVHRQSARNVRSFLDETLNLSLLGDEMVRVDSAWRLPESGQIAALEGMVARMRFGQMHAAGMRVAIPVRWFQFDSAPHGTRLLLRLLELPNPGLRSYMAGNLDEEGAENWVEYGIGGD